MAPSYLLDTNTVSYLLRGSSKALADRMFTTRREAGRQDGDKVA